jgi:RNA-directed DNA polymerase
MRENCTYSLSGGRWLARKRATSDPTPAKGSNAGQGGPKETLEGRPLTEENAVEPNPRPTQSRESGWLQYYGPYYRSALYPPMRQLDRSLARWGERKYKKLRGHLRRATHWVARISRRDPKLFAHWQMGVRRGSMVGAV